MKDLEDTNAHTSAHSSIHFRAQSGPKLKEIEELSELLKALANSTRLHVLTLLGNRQYEFQEIKEAVDLGKTALSNHLSKLEELGLISRPIRGTYQLTPLGRTYMNVNTALFREVKFVSAQSLVQQDTKLDGPADVKPAPKFEPIKVDHPAYFLNSWDSFSGCVAGIFQALGRDYDQIDISGYTGIAFTNTFDPTGITGTFRYDTSEWEAIYDILRKLGLRFDIFYEEFPFPTHEHISRRIIPRKIHICGTFS